MKKLIFIILILLALNVSSHAGWWNNDQQQIDRLNGQLEWEQKKDDGQGIAIVVLAVGVVVALGIGAAVGSKARRDAGRGHDN